MESSSLADALRAGPLGSRRIAGSVLGPYQVVSELGRGGFGAVFRARRRDAAGPDVALKVLLDGRLAATARTRRFEREAALARELRHPGIVPVLDAGEADGVPFVAFELVEGATLDRVCEGASVERVLSLVLLVARAVAHAHAHGVVHRDLKPANVLVRASDGQPLVTDFGLARDLALDSSLTNTGAALGTPAYMAPEQITGKEPTLAMDVFALGAILYETLTGDVPFLADNVALRFASIHAGKLDRPSARRAGVPPGVDEVVRRALLADPARRFPDAGAFAEALATALQGQDDARGRRRTGAVVGALVVVVVVVALLRATTHEAEAVVAPPVATEAAPPAPVPLAVPEVEVVLTPAAALARAREQLQRGDVAAAASDARTAIAGELHDADLAWGLEDAAKSALRGLVEAPAAPDVAAVRAAITWLDAARALDPARLAAPPDLLIVEDQLAARSDAPPAARWLVAAHRRRIGLVYDRAALRLTEVRGPLSVHDERLQRGLEAAGDDRAKLATAFRSFTHATRRDGTPDVAFEAEEEMAARCLPDQRRSWCISRGLTLNELDRPAEARSMLDEAVALAETANDDAGLSDACFWRAGLHAEPADTELDLRRSIEHGRRAAVPPKNGWVYLSLARALVAQGKHDDALTACADARRVGDVPLDKVEAVETTAHAALGR